MKKILTIMSVIVFTLTVFISCEKAEPLKTYPEGVTPVLSSPTLVVAPPASDSNALRLILNWTDPKYDLDPAKTKFTVEIDSAGRNFIKSYVRTVTGKLTDSITAKQLNTIMLAWGFDFNKAYDLDVRVTSSYPNNNESRRSNTIKIKATPYKIPPKVALPGAGRLFIVGDATPFGWSNDPTPPFPAVRELTRLDETTWGGVFNYTGNGGYKILQTQGNWGTQFHMLAGGTAYAGSFEQKDADPAFPSPNPGGWHKLIMDFQKGTFVVTTDQPCPDDLWLTGDAVGGWTNTPASGNKLTRLNNGEFEITYTWSGTPSGAYKLLSTQGAWQPQFGGSSATGGDLGANYGGGSDPAAIPAPSAAGTYKIRVNFVTRKYTVTKVP